MAALAVTKPKHFLDDAKVLSFPKHGGNIKVAVITAANMLRHVMNVFG
jgi:hypothetical protein